MHANDHWWLESIRKAHEARDEAEAHMRAWIDSLPPDDLPNRFTERPAND